MVVIGTTIHVRNNIEDFMADLHRQGTWLLWGAALTLLANVLTLIAQMWPLLVK